MKHLGDITKINGWQVEPVDVIIGGSPCQDLSIAGNRAGLAGERSGLFMEQLRVIKEMRCADAARGRTGADIRPRWMLWENVTGAFSSNKGGDFGAVLHETLKIICPQVPALSVPKGGWPRAGCLTDMGGKWSLAWRVFDAQFWGTPQRRKRITLVCDFGGLTAPEILFEREGVPGYAPPVGAPWQTFTHPAEAGAGAPGRKSAVGVDLYNSTVTGDVAATLTTGTARSSSGSGPSLLMIPVENHAQDCRYKINADGIVQTLNGKMGTGGNNVPLLLEGGGML